MDAGWPKNRVLCRRRKKCYSESLLATRRWYRRCSAFDGQHEFNSAVGTNFDVMTLSLEGDEKTGWKPGAPKPFANSPSNEGYPDFSPDGRWLAYGSDESGRFEVYVRPASGNGKWQISAVGAAALAGAATAGRSSTRKVSR